MENEPEVYSKIHKMMLPGDYIAMRMTGEIKTTPSGLSEGIMWDFEQHGLAELILDYYGISSELIAEVVPTFSVQGELTKEAAKELGLSAGTKISYRAGDQPNNALSLNVLCLNGTGILNSWLKHNFGESLTYDEMNELAGEVSVGSDGVVILPYGNGAERTLENKDIGASVHGLNFNRHNRAHLLRAAQEGIVFALNYGLGIMHQAGVEARTVRAGDANMFLSPLFAEAFATVTGTTVELYNTDGSQGAARGAGIGAGIYKGQEDAFVGLKPVKTIEPNEKLIAAYKQAYERWEGVLKHELKRSR
jgi:xylulokinase